MTNRRIVLRATIIVALGYLIWLLTTTPASGQTPVGRQPTCSQWVHVQAGPAVRTFRRQGAPGGVYGPWVEYRVRHIPAPPGGVRSRSVSPVEVTPAGVRAAMGDPMWRHFERYRVVVVSAQLNYSRDPAYDSKSFGGQKYGTWIPRKRGN